MGLRYTVDIIEDLGFPEATDELEIEIDYSEGLDIFVETFYDVATTLVPVDTGYLMSTIDCDNDGYSYIECWADAHYAQYVEFGTYKMRAQPYFVPALEEAFHAAMPAWKQAIEEAREEEREILESMETEEMGAAEEIAPIGFGGLFSALVMTFIAAAAIVAIDNFFELMGNDNNNNSKGISTSGVIQDFLEITD